MKNDTKARRIPIRLAAVLVAVIAVVAMVNLVRPEAQGNGGQLAASGAKFAAKEPDGHAESEKAEAGHSHAEEEGGEHADEGLKIAPEAMKEAGIVVTPLQPQLVANTVRAPGEVVPNRYRSGVVTPRIPGIVAERLAAAGERVRKGQPLAVMFSVEMAEAQGQFQIAEQEWRRVRQLGKEIVSDKRFNETDVQRKQAMAKLLSFGMSPREIESLADRGVPTNAGHFSLLAPQDGVIYSDEFMVGELVEPGKILFTIADSNTVWIDARVSPADAKKIQKGMRGVAHVAEGSREAVVAMINPTTDEATRTVSVRLEADNSDGRLRPGMFVDVELPAGEAENALAVPVDSVLRGPDGDWVVYAANGEGGLKAVEVKVVRNVAGVAVIEGVTPGTPVVTAGAFFVQSEAAKGAFDVHNH